MHFQLILYRTRSLCRGLFFFKICGCARVPAPFVEKIILSPLTCLCVFVKKKIRVLCLCRSVSRLSFLMPCSLCLIFHQYYTLDFIGSLNTGRWECLTFVLQDCFDCSSFFAFFIVIIGEIMGRYKEAC